MNQNESMCEVIVPSFAVDHVSMKAGLYLRETRTLPGGSVIKVWDLRFVAPSDHVYIPGSVMHSIEHIMAFKLREVLGDAYISFFPFGCNTGFGFISTGIVEHEDLRLALIEVIEHSLPIIERQEIPALTPEECGRPKYFSISKTNDWLQTYLQVLLSL